MRATHDTIVVNRQKLFAPREYAGAVEREEILQAVLESPPCPVVVLQAPAGHGKTTTLCQIRRRLKQDGARCAWLSLDDADNDPRRFFPHFEAMLANLRDGEEVPAEVSRTRLKDGQWTHSDWVLDQLLSVDGQVALFLDEFQELTNPEIHQFFRELCARLPPSATVVIGSRALPNIGLASLSVKQRVRILRSDELRFSPDEAASFFLNAGHDGVAADDIEAIYQRSEGWPAALQLFSLSLGNREVRDSLRQFSNSRPRELAEYLAESVVDQQPQELQDFLLRTSVLKRLNADLCEAVTGQANAQEMLEGLERGGLFVRALDPAQNWFKYHTLFAECLREKLREMPGAEEDVHRRAAHWYRSRELHESAVDHFLAAGDHASAADEFDRWAGHLVATGHLVTVERWASRLPAIEVMKRPSLVIKYAWALTFLRRSEILQTFLPLLEELREGGDVAESTDSVVVLSMIAVGGDDLQRSFDISKQFDINRPDVTGFAAFELGAAANLSAYGSLCCGELELAREQLAVAQDFNTRTDASFSYGYTVGLNGALLLIQGALGDGISRMQAGFRESQVERDKSAASSALVCCLVWAYYEAGRWKAAEELFEKYRGIIAEVALMDFMAVAYLSMSRVFLAQGRLADASALLDDMDHVGRRNRWPRLLQAVRWERIRQALQQGDLERARATARVGGMEDDDAGIQPFLRYVINPSLGRIRLAIRNQELDEAFAMLRHESAVCRGKTQQSIRVQLLYAEYWAARCDPKAAMRHLRSALQLAAPGGYVQCFVDEGEAILHLLQEFQRANAETDGGGSGPRVSQLAIEVLRTAGLETVEATASTDQLPRVELTDREQELLEFLASGISNREIARRVFVSENTVKFHLKNIYSKLGVRTRVQALGAARRLGMLDE